MSARRLAPTPPRAPRQPKPCKPPRGRQKVGPLPSAAAVFEPVAVRVEPTRTATQACVVVGISFPVNFWILDALHGTCPGGGPVLDVARLDETVLAFAAFEAVRDKLDGSTVDAIRNRVVGASCGAQNGEFLISVTCAPTLTGARKCAGIVLQHLRWDKLYQRYSNWCRTLGVRADKAAFSAAAEEANRATLARVEVVVAGKAAADDAGAAKTAEKLAQKVRDAGPRDAGRRRTFSAADLVPGAEKGASDLFAPHPAPGLRGVVVRNFVETLVRGEPSRLASGVLHVPKLKDAQAKRLGQSGSDRPDKFAQALLRLGDEARAAVVFIAAKGCHVATRELSIAGPFAAEDLAAAIRDAFR